VTTMGAELRPAKIEDAQACGDICYRAFKKIAERHGFPPDFPTPEMAIGFLTMILSRSDVHATVAERDGRVLASNVVWRGGAIAGIGPITVDPEVQDASIGRRLMEEALEWASELGFEGVRLVQAAYHNRSLALYTKLGFDAREPLSTIQGPPLARTLAGSRVRAVSEEDVERCSEVCIEVHGHDRAVELRDAIAQGTAQLVERRGRVTGYATSIGFVGHAVARTNEDMKALIAAAPAFFGPGFLLPTKNGDLLRWCLENGLRVVQPMTLMTMGHYEEPRGAFLPSILY